MDLLSSLTLIIHITAGTITLVAGPLAIFYNFKNTRNHRLAGKVFFYAMLIVCTTAVAGFLKQPERVFFQFLLGIAVLVLANILRGVRATRLMNGGQVRPIDFIFLALMGTAGLLMSGLAVWHYFQGTNPIIPILFGVFGLAGLLDTFRNTRLFLHAETMHRLDWYRMHVASMLAAFTASTTAFTVNAAPFLPWYLQWFGPALLLVPLQVYFGRILLKQKEQALEGKQVSV